MKYGLFVRGKMIRLTVSLQSILTSRAYEPWNPSVEIYEFKYNYMSQPIDAILIK